MTKRFATLLMTLATATGLYAGGCDIGCRECPGFCDPDCAPDWCAQDWCGRFFLRADALYWRPQVSGLDLSFGSGAIITEGDDPTVTNMIEYNFDPDFKWSAGYRLGAGYRLNDPNTSLGAIWTHFHGSGHRHQGEGDLHTSGKYRVTFDQVDTLIGYRSEPVSCVVFEPFLGVRWAKADSHLRATVITQLVIDDVEGTETRSFHDKQDYWGVGPVIGLNADWGLGCGFGLYGSVGAALLYGDYKVYLDDSSVLTIPEPTEIFSYNEKHVHSFDPNLNFAVGLRWRTCFCDDFQVELKLGFEHWEYFDQSRIGANYGNLSFDGGIFSATVTY